MGHYVAYHRYRRVLYPSASGVVADGVESVGCGHCAGADRCACDHAMGPVLVEKNGLHLCDTGVLMVVATDLGSVPACGTVLGHDTHPGVGNIGGLVPHVLSRTL